MSAQTLQEQKETVAFCFEEGIHLIESPLGDRLLRQFLLLGEDAALLIDTGLNSTPRECIAPYLAKIGLDPLRVRYVLISHADFDHQGGNIAARQLFPRAAFICHHLDQPLIESTDRLIEERYGEFKSDHGIGDEPEASAWIRDVSRSETPVDIALTNEAAIRLDVDWTVQLLHTPGHSLGHLSVWEPRSQTAIIADAVLSSCLLTRDGRPAFPPTYRYVDAYRQTIARLKQLKPKNLLTSHYSIKSGPEVETFFDESLHFVDRLDKLLREEIAKHESQLSARALIERLSPRLGSWPVSASYLLMYPMMGHLEKLEQSGAVQARNNGSFVTWTSGTGVTAK